MLNFLQKKISSDYIQQFWVGLMDGDGSIQVNHWRFQYLQYRFVIKLKFSESNYDMLQNISFIIGGKVQRVVIKKTSAEFVIWVVNSQYKIKYLLLIFAKYPPLTTRVQCQLRFLISFIDSPLSHTEKVKQYFKIRNAKYSTSNQNRNESFHNIVTLPYYKPWLSGFIEAEGCFSIRKPLTYGSFSIGQNTDYVLLDSIRYYFKANSKIRLTNNKKFYTLETYNRSVFACMRNHFQLYPLLGQKDISFKNFVKILNI